MNPVRSRYKPRVADVVATAIAELLVALACFVCYATYASTDPSGVQGIGLVLAGILALVGGGVLAMLRGELRLPWTAVLIPLLTLLVVALPAVFDWNDRGVSVDRIGLSAGLALFIIQVAIGSLVTWRLARSVA